VSLAERGRDAALRARSKAGDLLPERVRYVLWQRVAPRVGLGRALGHRVPEPIDTSRVELLDQVPEEELRDAGRLEREVLPRLGLNADLTELLPPALHPYLDQGLRYSQYPNQFGPYLACLARYPVRSYMEVGVQHGGTFLITTAYLSRLHALDRAVAVDMFAVPALQGRPIAAAHFDVLKLDSTSRRFADYLAKGAPFDLVLVDGDHSEEGCRRDFERVAPHARMVAFHDIVGVNTPGVAAVWRWLRRAHADRFVFHEFTDQYPEVVGASGDTYLGLGLAVRKDFEATADGGAGS
jgi:hypothetical protein